MSGDEITKVGIWDDRLKPSTPAYAIRHGALSITSQAFAALTSSSAQHVYSVNVPSLQTYVDRFVLWSSQLSMEFQIGYQASTTITLPASAGTGSAAAVTATVIAIPVAASGIDFALASFPLHRLTTSMLLSINDVSTTLNTAQVLPSLLRMLDDPDARANVTTPNKLDVFQQCGAARGSQAGPYTAFDSSNYGNDAPNGAFPFLYAIPSTAVGSSNITGVAANNSFNGLGFTTPASFTITIPVPNYASGVYSATTGINIQAMKPLTSITNGTNGYYLDGTISATQPLVVLVVNGVPYLTPIQIDSGTLNNAVPTASVLAGSSYKCTVGVVYTVTENLLTSPFTSGGPASTVDSAMFGINNFQLTCQMQTPQNARLIRQLDAGRTISYGSSGGYVATTPFSSSKLYCNFLTPPVSLHVPARSIVPYTELVSYPFGNQATVKAFAAADINSQVITFSQIPDYVIIRTPAVAVTGSTGTYTDPAQPMYGDVNLPITKVNVTFDNASGLLSALPQYRLWHISKENGIKMPWLQWSSGTGGIVPPNPPGVWVAAPTPGFIGTSVLNINSSLNVSAGIAPTSGGELVLAFGKDIALYETLAPGCSGNFSFFITVTIVNTFAFDVSPTITLISVNSGFWTCVGGQSSRTTTPLTQPQVLASAQSHKDTGGLGASMMDMKRLVGAGFWDHVSSALSKGRDVWQQHGAKLQDYAGKAADALEQTGSKRARDVAGLLGKVAGRGGGIEARFQ